VAPQTTTAAEMLDRRAKSAHTSCERTDKLDDVDLGRQVARDLEANFLLTNSGLRPDLHDIPPKFGKLP
jgi:hypothetical protein